jgi:hypothetical protein
MIHSFPGTDLHLCIRVRTDSDADSVRVEFESIRAVRTGLDSWTARSRRATEVQIPNGIRALEQPRPPWIGWCFRSR